MGPAIVILLRLIVPLSIFKWPLGGFFFSAILDAADVILITLLKAGDFTNYHSLDKILDSYFMFFGFLVSLSWKNKLARNTSVFLFVYRMIGVVLFEITHIRPLLLIFPNLFLNFYLFYLLYKRIVKKDPIKKSYKNLIVILLILLIPKMAQEYALHYKQLKPWNWTKENILNIREDQK